MAGKKDKGGEEQKEEVKTPQVKDKWEVRLVIISEEEKPKKVLVKGEETLDIYSALAKILNELEKLNETLMS